MTDGTTGIQVAPITEDEMSLVQNILKRAVDAAVGLSQLQADVQSLRDTVHGLQVDTERLRTQNSNLDEALTRARAERDAAKADLSYALANHNDADIRATSLQQLVNDLGLENSVLKADLNQALEVADIHYLDKLGLQDELKEALAKLEAIREGFESIFGKAPEAMQPAPVPAIPVSASVSEPASPIAASLEVDWSKPYHYDEVTGGYVNDPEPSQEPAPARNYTDRLLPDGSPNPDYIPGF